MKNIDVTTKEKITAVPSNNAPFSAVLHNGASISGISDSAEQQQQQQQRQKTLPASTLPSILSSDAVSPPIYPFPNDVQQAFASARDNQNTEFESRNRGYNNDNQNFPIDNGNDKDNDKGDSFTSAENDLLHNVFGMTQNQRQRSMSAASFGSFSVDEELVPESDGNSRDLTVKNYITTSVAVVPENALPHQKEPQVVKTGNDSMIEYRNKFPEKDFVQRSQQQTLLTKEEEMSRLSPPPSTTNDGNMRMARPIEENDKKNDSGYIENNDKLNRYEKSLLALGRTQNINDAQQTAPKTGALKNTSAEAQYTRIPQPRQNKQEQQQQQQQQQKLQGQVIELLDNDDETNVKPSNHPQMAVAALATSGVKRSRPPETIVPGSSLHGHNNHYNAPRSGSQTFVDNNINRRRDISSGPQFINLTPNHIPTWEDPLPPLPRQPQVHANQYKHFELSLLNVSEFTITGLPVTLDGRCSSVLGFRKIVKEVSRGHGKAIFERDNPKQENKNRSTDTPSTFSTEQYSSYGGDQNPDGGKWRIPLGAYRAFYSYLQSDNMCKVKGIPEDQLKIASLGKARLEKGFPSAQKIISYGVPKGLATALAPFQRGGVEFVVEKEGRALIADDMGLGKTIQSIASMSVYHDEWPLLVLTPSTARYHWAAEFNNWLGSGSSVNKKNDSSNILDQYINQGEKPDACREDDATTIEPRKPMRLLKESEIHVMIAGKEKMFPNTETRIVICSYGLATSLVDSGKLHIGLFRCAIVDESHMLKNIKTKRTSKLVPILHATNRCILLSGTPALARPTELWPQLKILSTERDGWWDDENDFIRKYVQRTTAIRRAELHTMLTGTVMIRRMKHDMLKSLPSKRREKAIVDVVTPEMRRDFHNCMKLLREGKGVMAKIAKRHTSLTGETQENELNPAEEKKKKLESLQVEYDERCRLKLQNIRLAMQSIGVNDEENEKLVAAYYNEAKIEVDVWYKERFHELQKIPLKKAEEELDRKTILNKMYSMTAKAKIPLIAELVGKWLDDPTKGKLCIFAHHIFVLDEIVKLVGLSNTQGSRKRFIRIDGSTSPKERQAQIVSFQNDPDIRIAVLGITAAGVAVTLTASSTVWFTELFWTPALMIQAEDRCHRIGQNAAVKCLYFVVTGTLDVLLWDLLEKKFQDLGEFVEGKEKMKMVVHHVFKSVKEFKSNFVRPGDDDLDEDAKQNETESEAEGDDLIKLESDLQEDIVQLAQEEMVMISQGEDEDGGDNNKRIGKATSEENLTQIKSSLGQTEDEAICLSDDEDDNSVHNNEVGKLESKNDLSPAGSGDEKSFRFSKSRVLDKCRFYKQYFEGSSYGIQLVYVGHRLAVANNTFGKSKPTLGDVLIAVNGYRLPLACPLNHVCRYMKQLLKKGTVELIFMEDETFVMNCLPYIFETMNGIETVINQGRNKKLKDALPTKNEDVIEILDDD